MRQAPRAVALAAVALLAVGLVSACGSNPPQIVDYAPQRGTTDVSTSLPIRVSFDRDVDKASVEGRLHTDPQSTGYIVWLNNRTLSYVHQPLAPSTVYQAILDAGYRAATGDVYQLRHHWQFTTEGPPSMSGSVPAFGERGVDPSAYVVVTFTREMDQASVAAATSITPATPFAVRLDPSDRRHVIVAPNSLLQSDSQYRVTITTAALDVDGNHIDRAQTFNFTTGEVRPLRHWVAFIADDGSGSSAVWIVDESRFPRQLFNESPVVSFSWSPEGQRLMLRGTEGVWTVLTVGGLATPLGFNATWAAALAPGLGYVYLDSSGTLHHFGQDGIDEEVARGVTEAAVSPQGNRIAFVLPTAVIAEIWGYDVGLHASYRLTSDAGVLTNLAWARTGSRLAYLLDDGTGSHLKVLTLGATSTKTTVASGDLGPPAWLPDSNHLVFSAAVETSRGTMIHKAFLISTSSPPSALTASGGLPAANTVDVVDPVPSPDGHQIAFVNQAGDYNELWLMNADGTDPAPLTRFDTAVFPYSSTSPAWTRA